MKNSIKVTENVKVELNEHGNVSKVEMTEVLSEVKGNLQASFHYRIEKEAEISGPDFPTYCEINIEYENPMTEDTLKFAHEHFYPKQISEEHEIELEHITPISKEEYDKRND